MIIFPKTLTKRLSRSLDTAGKAVGIAAGPEKIYAHTCARHRLFKGVLQVRRGVRAAAADPFLLNGPDTLPVITILFVYAPLLSNGAHAPFNQE